MAAGRSHLFTSFGHRGPPRRRISITHTRRTRLPILAAIKKAREKNVVCSKTLVALEGQETAVEALCEQVTAFGRSRAKDRSAGVVSFSWSKDASDHRVFHFWEVYETNEALGSVNSAPEVKQFMENVQEHLEEPIGLALFEMTNGKLGPAAVQAGPKGEGGLDDATGASGAAGGAGYKQTSGAVDLTAIEEEDDRGFWGLKLDFPWMKKR